MSFIKWCYAFTLILVLVIHVVICNHDEGADNSCKVRKVVHTIEQPDCVTKRFLSLACRGRCRSYTMFSSETDQVEHQCSCCQASEKQERRVQLLCKSGAFGLEIRTFRMMLPTSCMCRPCSDKGASEVPEYINPTDMQSSLSDFLLV